MLTDMHNHTFSSFDGKQSVSDVCAAAERAGVGIIAVAEHFDCDDRGGMLHFPNHFEDWLAETEKVKKPIRRRFSDKKKEIATEQEQSVPEIV